MKTNKTLLWGGLAVLILVLCVALFPWNWLRGPIGQYVSEKSGREFLIKGDLTLKPGWRTEISLSQVHIDNAKWASTTPMLDADRIVLVVDTGALLLGRIVLTELRLHGAEVSLERDMKGQRNWILEKSDDGRRSIPEIQRLTVSDSRIRYKDAVLDTDLEIQASTNEKDPLRPTQLSFTGSYRKLPLAGTASTGSVLSLQNAKTLVPARLQLKVGKTSVLLDGNVSDLAGRGSIDAKVDVSGTDLSQLYPILPVVLPSTPPYRFSGQLQGDGTHYSYRDFSGKVGNSDLKGEASFVRRQPRPQLTATLESSLLDLNDLGPLIGLAPTAFESAVAPQDNSSPAVRKVLPRKPFRLDRLRAMDADVRLSAKRIQRPSALPLEDMRVHLLLENGLLRLAPLEFGFSGGRIAATISLDGQQSPIAAQATIDMRNVKLQELFPTVELMRASFGTIGAQIKLRSVGNSIATLLANADGEAGLAMVGGEFSGLLLEAVDMNGAGILKYLALGDKSLPNRCSVVDFEIRKGLATSQLMVFDTAISNIQGSGTLDFRNEQIDVLLIPQPKKKSILAARTPIRVHGPFSQAEFSLQKGPLLARGGAVMLLSALNPFAAVLALLETGPGKDADCAALLSHVVSAQAQAKRSAKPASLE